MMIGRRDQNGAIARVHIDHLGSTSAQTDGAGNVLGRQRYSPFGIELENNTLTDDRSGFTGHIKDKSTGLNYMQARYYDPNIGRFLSIDPVTFMDTGNPSQFNRYSYVSNDPINLIDPTGMVERELNRPDKGQTINVEAGDLSQKQVNEIADQLPQGVFDALDGQDLSDHSVSTKEFNFKTNEYSYKGSEGQDTINIGNQIGTGLVPPSKEFPAASSLTHAKTNTTNGQALSGNNNLITSGAVEAGITQVISTSIHERGHQGGAPGGSTTGHTNLYRKVNKIMNSVGSSSRTPDCSVRGAC